MIDVGSVPLWTRVATSTAVQVFTGECELVRLIFPTSRSTTDSVTVYNGTSAVGTFGIFKQRAVSTIFLDPGSVEVGAVFGTGIRVKMVTLEPIVVVYRGRAA